MIITKSYLTYNIIQVSKCSFSQAIFGGSQSSAGNQIWLVRADALRTEVCAVQWPVVGWSSDSDGSSKVRRPAFGQPMTGHGTTTSLRSQQLVLLRGIWWWAMDFSLTGPVTWKAYPCHDVFVLSMGAFGQRPSNTLCDAMSGIFSPWFSRQSSRRLQSPSLVVVVLSVG